MILSQLCYMNGNIIYITGKHTFWAFIWCTDSLILSRSAGQHIRVSFLLDYYLFLASYRNLFTMLGIPCCLDGTVLYIITKHIFCAFIWCIANLITQNIAYAITRLLEDNIQVLLYVLLVSSNTRSFIINTGSTMLHEW